MKTSKRKINELMGLLFDGFNGIRLKQDDNGNNICDEPDLSEEEKNLLDNKFKPLTNNKMSIETEVYVRSKKFRPIIGWLEKSLSQFSEVLPPKGYSIWLLDHMSEKDLKSMNRENMTMAYGKWNSLSEFQKSTLLNWKALSYFLKNGFNHSILYGELE